MKRIKRNDRVRQHAKQTESAWNDHKNNNHRMNRLSHLEFIAASLSVDLHLKRLLPCEWCNTAGQWTRNTLLRWLSSSAQFTFNLMYFFFCSLDCTRVSVVVRINIRKWIRVQYTQIPSIFGCINLNAKPLRIMGDLYTWDSSVHKQIVAQNTLQYHNMKVEGIDPIDLPRPLFSTA